MASLPRRLWSWLGPIGKIKLLMTLATSGFVTSFLADTLDFLWQMRPALRWIAIGSFYLLVGAVILAVARLIEDLAKRWFEVPEGPALLEPRYEPYDPRVNPSLYEVPSDLDGTEYRLGVFNAGPSVARNVVVQVMEVSSTAASPAEEVAKPIEGFPVTCRRADVPSDDCQINPRHEALYQIGDIQDVAAETGIKRVRRVRGFRFDWQKGYRLRIGIKHHRVTVRFRITGRMPTPLMAL